MPDSLLFIGVARNAGYDPTSAAAALAAVRARLNDAEIMTRRFYIYRTGDSSSEPGSTPPAKQTRPRLLLAFPSPDAALAFAQQRQFANSPRLMSLSLGQLLAALIQRPTIIALLVANETNPDLEGGLPTGVRIERAALIELLAGVIL